LRKAIGNQASALSHVQEKKEYNDIAKNLPLNSAYMNKYKFVNPKNYLTKFKKFETLNRSVNLKPSQFNTEKQEQQHFRQTLQENFGSCYQNDQSMNLNYSYTDEMMM